MKMRKRRKLRPRPWNRDALWRNKRERQHASLASGVNGSWFVHGIAQRAVLMNSPY